MKKPPPKMPRPCDCWLEVGTCYCENPTPKGEKKMTIKKALKVLQKHQQWRKGSHQIATDPFELSQALEVAIAILDSEANYCQCKHPMPNSKFGVFECMNCEKTMKP